MAGVPEDSSVRYAQHPGGCVPVGPGAGDESAAGTSANGLADRHPAAAPSCCRRNPANMTISLAFLAPDLVKAAIAGRLPHGMGVARLADMPAEWSRQHQMLGLPSA